MTSGFFSFSRDTKSCTEPIIEGALSVHILYIYILYIYFVLAFFLLISFGRSFKINITIEI